MARSLEFETDTKSPHRERQMASCRRVVDPV